MITTKALFTGNVCFCASVNFNIVFLVLEMQTQRLSLHPLSGFAFVSILAQYEIWCKCNADASVDVYVKCEQTLTVKYCALQKSPARELEESKSEDEEKKEKSEGKVLNVS